MAPVRHPNGNVPRGGDRRRTLSHVVLTRRRLEILPRGGGRAWVNGREVGGPDARFGHLDESHD